LPFSNKKLYERREATKISRILQVLLMLKAGKEKKIFVTIYYRQISKKK
jgi:hypothetical protein